ncbi:MAG: Glu-tRNA(Gln) amidotransferase subunit GatE [Candidatus Bathyarchaeota archaeon]|nr:Glu-tRNA(Gln) amidotransferase subunit GatE [Candidatus Bathyarchaeota archaeon]
MHQQLNTIHKLFCSCTANLSTQDAEFSVYRRLRPTQSELGTVDPAAAFEFQRGRGYEYHADNYSTCLVELDEEPPHRLSDEAIDIGITIALMLNAHPVDEVHVMRKIVIDGSNTTGFQRSCILALGGDLKVDHHPIQLHTICLEEDAARKINETSSITTYRLDRLCIPLIEVTTAPVIYSPDDAQKVALAIGRILRATNRVKRGLGTIRQDLNISIRDGAITEIKGVQQLNLISTVVKYEVQRQLSLLEIRDELQSRGVHIEDISENLHNITSIFNKTRSQLIKQSIKQGAQVYAIVLPNFNDLLGYELAPGLRFGTELSDYAKFWGRVGGIFHSDEMPAYGITIEEVSQIKLKLNIQTSDAFVFVAADASSAKDALLAVIARAQQAIQGIPAETRGATLDGTTHYSRPRPGAARMYPETDVPPVPITFQRLERIRETLPESPEIHLARLQAEYNLNAKLASQLQNSKYNFLFERIARETSIPPTFIAATLTETLRSLRRDGIDVDSLSMSSLFTLFSVVDANLVAKEAIPQVLQWMVEHHQLDPHIAIESLGLKLIPLEQLEDVVDAVLNENQNLIMTRQQSAIGPLMGVLMKQYRGQIDAQALSQLLTTKIKKMLDR